MKTYTYLLSNLKGEKNSGTIKAFSDEDAVRQIRKKNWFVMSIAQEKKNFFSLSNKKLSTTELIDFTDHLSAMISSGTPIVEALGVYAEEEGEKLTKIINDIILDVRQGKKLSEALASYPQSFSPLYLAFVKTGETTGKLDETLNYLARELRRHHEYKEKIKSALIYPSIVIVAAIAVVTLLVFLVIPRVVELSSSISGEMPTITKIVVAAAQFIKGFGALLLLGIALAMVTLVAGLKNKKIKQKADPFLLKIPIIGPLLKKYILAYFLQVVGSCLKYGIPIILSFKTISDVVGNEVYRKSCNRVEKRIIKGSSFSDALAAEGNKIFPRSIIRNLRGAEKTGSLDAAMIRLSVHYEKQINRSLKRLTDLIEPALVVVMGLIVGAIAIAVIAPIYKLTTTIK